MIEIRAEQSADQKAIYEVNALAFAKPAEAQLVDKLREAGAITLSLVALDEGRIVGMPCFHPLLLRVKMAKRPLVWL